MAVSTLAVRLAALNAMAGVGQPLAAATLILYSNGFVPSPAMAIGSVVECTFAGYAAVAGLTFGSSYLDGNGTPCISAPSEQFEATGPTPTETIYGFALVNAAKTILYYAENLPTPIPITAAEQGVMIQPTIRYGE